MDERTPHRKIRVGTVVSNKMEKTIVVRVTRHDRHPLYGKKIIKAKSYVAHDENNVSCIGDTVSIGGNSLKSSGRRLSSTVSLKILRRPRHDTANDGSECGG